MPESRVVSTAEELHAAIADGVQAIEVSGTIKGAPRVVLAPGVRLRGGRLEFGSKGVLLSRDNTVEDIEVVVPEHEVAIYADTTQADWGRSLAVWPRLGRCRSSRRTRSVLATSRSTGSRSRRQTSAAVSIVREGSASRRCRVG